MIFNNTERKILLICLLVIVFCSICLIVKIESEPKYNAKLYDEIYSEYEELFDDNISCDQDNNSTSNSLNIESKVSEVSDTSEKINKVVGKIIIPKIEISYPIINETNDENLKIAPTKMFGPDPNEVGNLVIVGHNYKNNKFFSNLSQLEKGDRILLISNNKDDLTYTVYDKFEISENDMQCTCQDTNGNIELTLITCTTNKNKRLAVKAKANI